MFLCAVLSYLGRMGKYSVMGSLLLAASLLGSAAHAQPSAPDAARFLTQASFGPNAAQIAQVRELSYDGWLNQQFAQPASLQRAELEGPGGVYALTGSVTREQRQEIWWRHAITAPDQLRQRVAFALSEILVVSELHDALHNQPLLLAEYYDVLTRNAFGNYRQLLQEITLSPAMGLYLNMLRNQRGTPQSGQRPDENFAREVQQLFSIGTVELNADGSVQQDAEGTPLPAYNQRSVESFARAFTGWTWADANDNWYARGSSYQPMKAFEDRHDTGAKTLLKGVQLPAGQSAAQDLAGALDNLFLHPNTAPFICRRLIQRLTSSNPSPGYIQRVAQVFENNGSGQRGDLKSVVAAILLDPETRAPAGDSSGKLREPLLRLTALWRAFTASAASGKFNYPYAEHDFAQAPLRSPSVFNFFQPDYSAPGEVSERGLVAPEFQLQTQSQSLTLINALTRFVRYQYEGAPGDDQDTIRIKIGAEKALAADPVALVNHLDLLLLAGQMSFELREVLLDHLQRVPAADGTQRAVEAIFLIAASPEFAVQK